MHFQSNFNLKNKIVSEDINAETYNRTPITGFGEKMLELQGFQGKIGKTFKKSVEVPEIKIRPHRLGLGAKIEDLPQLLERKKKRLEQLSKKQVDSLLVNLPFKKNDIVQVTYGKYQGYQGIVNKVQIDENLILVEVSLIKLKKILKLEAKQVIKDSQAQKKEAKDQEDASSEVIETKESLNE